jgi:hypothetical protein
MFEETEYLRLRRSQLLHMHDASVGAFEGTGQMPDLFHGSCAGNKEKFRRFTSGIGVHERRKYPGHGRNAGNAGWQRNQWRTLTRIHRSN